MEDMDKTGIGDHVPEDTGNGDTPPEGSEDKKIDQDAQDKKEWHEEKTRMGRQIKEMREMLGESVELQREYMMRPPMQPAPAQDFTPKPPEMSDDDYMTVADFKKFQTFEKQREASQMQKYGQIYIGKLRSLAQEAGVDEATYNRVIDMTTKDGSPFNKRSHDYPDAAAQINFFKALNHIQSEKGQTPPGRRDTNLPPAGEDDKTKTKDAAPEYELTAEMKEYAERRGLKPEQVKKLMEKNDGPAYSGRRF